MIGNFDGVHRGHQKLIALTVKRAKLLGAQPCALTFSPHPRRFFQGASEPPMLTDDVEKASLLQSHGIEQTVVLPFDAALANQSPLEFVEKVLKRDLGAVHVVVGAGYRFGRGREGGVDDLRRLGRTHGFGVTVASRAVCASGEEFSSTRVRQALAQGDLVKARAFLGRSWSHVAERLK